jgi:hypothetical protein
MFREWQNALQRQGTASSECLAFCPSPVRSTPSRIAKDAFPQARIFGSASAPLSLIAPSAEEHPQPMASTTVWVLSAPPASQRDTDFLKTNWLQGPPYANEVPCFATPPSTGSIEPITSARVTVSLEQPRTVAHFGNSEGTATYADLLHVIWQKRVLDTLCYG